MRTLALKMAARLTGQPDLKQDFRMVAYGLELMIDGLIQVVLILALAWLLGIFQPVAVAMGAAMLYRRYSGGVHCTSFARCTLISSAVFLGLGYLTRWLGQEVYIAQWFNWTALGISLLAGLGWAPAENPVKPIPTAEKRIELRQKSLLILAIAAVVIWCGYQRVLPLSLVTGIAVGMLWQSFTITPPGYWFIGLIDRCLTIKNKGGREDHV